jgi:hypothetical protein
MHVTCHRLRAPNQRHLTYAMATHQPHHACRQSQLPLAALPYEPHMNQPTAALQVHLKNHVMSDQCATPIQYSFRFLHLHLHRMHKHLVYKTHTSMGKLQLVTAMHGGPHKATAAQHNSWTTAASLQQHREP